MYFMDGVGGLYHALRIQAKQELQMKRFQYPLGRIQKLSCHVPPGAMLCSSLYVPFCARLSASVIPAIGSIATNPRVAGGGGAGAALNATAGPRLTGSGA